MASDVSIPPELGMFQLSRTMQFMGTERPWLKLYGIRVRPVAPFGSLSSRPFVDPALIHRCLPDELLMEVFTLLDPYSLGRAACVCRKWKYTIRNPSLWRSACLKVWQLSGAVANYKFVQAKYEGSWRKMWLRRPRIRNDGLYVSRNTYIRSGASQWNITNTPNVVCYYRYLRFYHNGKFLYKVSSQKVREVAKCMNFRELKSECVFKGSYTLTEDQVEAVLLYPGLCRTLLRIRLRIRGTTLGANNRMDLLRLVTTGIDESEINNDDIFAIIEGWQEDETHDPDIPAITHTRGLTPFVFVPFEEVETSVLNLPVDKMDYYVTG